MTQNRLGWTGKFLAVVRYEILWNIRKKKFLGILVVAFALATLSLAGGHIASAITGDPVEPNPDFVINANVGLGGFGFFLFAIVTTMNTISGEFESGTIVPLLAKPISRTTVFFGKLFAAFLTLLATYCFLMVYMTIGGYVVYGPQNNLHLVPLSLLGALFSTLIWIAIVLLLGTVSRSSLIAALGALGIWLGTAIIGSIIGALAGQGWILTYIPGSGNTGSVGGPPQLGFTVTTGTDSIGPNLINYILHPSWEVTYYKIDIGGTTPEQVQWIALNSEPLSTIILTSIAVALIYFIVFVATSWYFFRRAQVTE
ncbi:MAG: ABC transporter permease [Candidatus Bathyarchaeota archaeon]|nr:ABC transporter permease [Candidatus Bathyarchaeota archaeon]MDH5733810.1 ABC transporter permease [Candidatus Bathyarchaeota archaeon]